MLLSEYPYPSKYDGPKPHQKETVLFYLRNKRAYNLSGMGVGKTLSTLWTCDFLFCNDKIKSVLVITPLSTIDTVWAQEIKDHIPHRTYSVLHGSKQIRINALAKDAHFFIINHDGTKVIEKELIKKKFDVVVIDELTCCKNAQSKRTKSIKRICDKAKAVWGLTGEPTPNSPVEAFGQAKVVNPARAPRYFTHFRDKVMLQLDMYTYIPRDGWEQQVAAILYPSIRYTLDQVAKDMPPISFQTRKFEMTSEQKRAYTQMYKDFVIEYDKGMITAVNSGVKANKLLQISCGSVINTETEQVLQLDNKHKLNGILEIIAECKKLIVFVPFRDSIESVAQFLIHQGYKVGVVHGDVKKDVRARLFNEFQKRDLEILVMHPRTSAHGLTLTASYTIIWFSAYADNEIYNQANARIRRFGQEHPQNVIRFQCSKAESRVYSILTRKGRLSGNLLELFSNPTIC